MRHVLAGLFALSLTALAYQEVKEPAVPANMSVRPVVHLKSGKEMRAGTAVIARVSKDGPPLLLTALHIFGPDGGLEKQIPSASLGEQVVKVVGEALDGETGVIATAAGSKIKNGFPYNDKGDFSGDVAAFAVEGTPKSEGVLLAEKNPKAGDPLWIVGEEITREQPKQRLWSVKVKSVTAKALILTSQVKFTVRAFSGAPIVDAKGQLVGLLIGSDARDADPGTQLYAIGASSIRKRLEDSK